MEHLKDYNFHLSYHPGKTNVVANALIQKGKVDKGQQLARPWAMMVEVVAISLVEQLTGLLAKHFIPMTWLVVLS